ncbi:MAG: HAMP domain-containing histidine kinase [Crocinitomicaceae bacterium]|nr:HAMP domain-containing histidine kinase [Crocinitomicaceae bacterium]MCF8444125.1 HAMP domain-containing histidine kinase [Crocinitomicaceae bacterium]
MFIFMYSMGLYSNKQRWKIFLLIGALVLVIISLYVSNIIVSDLSRREREKATQWAEAIKKKLELVKLTNNTFTKLRNREKQEVNTWIDATRSLFLSPIEGDPSIQLAFSIINKNTDIPVIVLDDQNNVTNYKNTPIDTAEIRSLYPEKNPAERMKLLDDSLQKIALKWKSMGRSFTANVFEGMTMTCTYFDSKELLQLEKERDSIIGAFNKELIENQDQIPVLLVDSKSGKSIGDNLKTNQLSEQQRNEVLRVFKQKNPPIILDFKDGTRSLIYYDESAELKKLQWYPVIQFIIIGLFVFTAYLVFSTFRKAEQNQVWAGMAKETAHQLGTPLSSLMAWVQYLETQNIDPMIVNEMQKDVDRLEIVTDRFSKIGSGAKMENKDLVVTIGNILDYLRTRISDKVTIDYRIVNEGPIFLKHNPSLIEWVVENICKNGVDAMEGKGKIQVQIAQENNWIHIDITDTGKGMSKKQYSRIFKPGFSTKTRGWGLGLTLAHRIVKNYHQGKLFVLQSEIGKGTCFRISLPAN